MHRYVGWLTYAYTEYITAEDYLNQLCALSILVDQFSSQSKQKLIWDVRLLLYAQLIIIQIYSRAENTSKSAIVQIKLNGHFLFTYLAQ